MGEVALKDLDPRVQKQVAGAKRALQAGSAAYAVDVLMGVMQRHPGCLEARRLLRMAQENATASGEGKFSKFLGSVTRSPFRLSHAALLRKNPMAVLYQAEKTLCKDPLNLPAHRLVAEAAGAVGFSETEIFAWERVCLLDPFATRDRFSLARACALAGRNENAVQACEQILAQVPTHSGALELIKRCSVAQTMEAAGWHERDSARSNLKNRNSAVATGSLEVTPDSRRGRGNQPQSRIDELRRQVAANPEQLHLYEEIASLYSEMRRFEAAVAWIKRASAVAGPNDRSRLRRIALAYEVSGQEANVQSMNQRESSGGKDPDDDRHALEEARKVLLASRLELYELLVKESPGDHGHHLEYGKLLLAAEEIESAALEFQKAQKSPKYLGESLFYLGRAFRKGGKLDLAVAKLEEAKASLKNMTESKLGILYELAETFEEMGLSDKAMAEYKAIYASDVGYRDVARKIERHYGGEPA